MRMVSWEFSATIQILFLPAKNAKGREILLFKAKELWQND